MIKLPPTERFERTAEHIVQVPVPLTFDEVAEVVKAVKNVPQERISERKGETDDRYLRFRLCPQTGKAPQAQFLINQVTKHAEISQTQYCDKVIAAMPVVIQRQVPRTQTCSKTVEVLPVQSIGRVANVPVIMQITKLPEVMFNKVTKHVEAPQIHFFDQGVCRAACDTATGPSDTDGFENREIPDGTVRRQSGGRARDHDDHAVGAQGDRGARQARRVPDQLDRVLLCTAMTFVDEQIANSLVPMTQARLFEVVESVPELLALRVEENEVGVPDPPIQERIDAVVADILKHLVPCTWELIEDMPEQKVDVPVLPTREHGDAGG